MIEDAEIGFERGAFALRWRHFIESKRTETSSDSHSDNQSAQTNNVDSSDKTSTQTPPSICIVPRFPDTDTRMAPAAPQLVEGRLRELKQKVLTAYKSHKTKSSNHSKSEKQALDTAQQDKSVIYKRSDKGKGLVVMSKEAYVSKAKSVVSTNLSRKIQHQSLKPKQNASYITLWTQ